MAAITVGYQGMGNVGDEAILRGIRRVAAGLPINFTASIGGRRESTAMAGIRLIMPRSLPGRHLLQALRRADLLIVAGGGLVNDYWATLIPRYLLLSVTARLLGCRVAWIGVGVGPLRRRPLRWLARAMMRLSDVCAVRDESSAKLLEQIGIHSLIVPDPAWFSAHPRSSGGGAGVGVIVREPAPGNERLSDGLIEAIVALVANDRFARAWTILLMDAGADGTIATRLSHALQLAGLHAPIVTVPADTDEAVAMLGGFEAIVSMRLHGLILSSLAGTPCLPVVYDPKVLSAAKTLGLGEVSLALADVTPERVIEGLRLVRRGDVREHVARRVEAILARRHELADALAHAVKQAGRRTGDPSSPHGGGRRADPELTAWQGIDVAPGSVTDTGPPRHRRTRPPS